MTKCEHVGARVRRLREARGYDRQWLSGLWGCTVANVSQVENGSRALSLQRAASFADALGISVDTITAGAKTGRRAS